MSAATEPIDGGKYQATLTALLCLKGFQVYEVTTGGFFVARHDRTKFCPALADLEAFAQEVGAA